MRINKKNIFHISDPFRKICNVSIAAKYILKSVIANFLYSRIFFKFKICVVFHKYGVSTTLTGGKTTVFPISTDKNLIVEFY